MVFIIETNLKLYQIGNKIKNYHLKQSLRIDAFYLTVGSQIQYAVREYILKLTLLTNTMGKVIISLNITWWIPKQ